MERLSDRSKPLSSPSATPEVPSDRLERIEELLAIAVGQLEKAKKKTCLGQGEVAVPLMDEVLEILERAERLTSEAR